MVMEQNETVYLRCVFHQRNFGYPLFYVKGTGPSIKFKNSICPDCSVAEGKRLNKFLKEK
jgi:hypothetical protein